MQLDWILLANHAEVAPNGLLYVNGGGWDTINVMGEMPPGIPEGIAAVMQGSLAIRLLFHVTETDRSHEFSVTIMAEDGQKVGEVTGQIDVPRNEAVPPGWLQNVNVVFPVTGVALPAVGLYLISVGVDGQWLGDRPFRVVKHEGESGALGSANA